MFRTGSILKDLLGVLALVAAAALVGRQCYKLLIVPEEPDHPTQIAMGDFRDVIYYPVQAAIAGINPYDGTQDGDPTRYRARYPVGNNFPLYSPLIFVPALPFASLPIYTSIAVWWIVNATLTVVLAYVALRWCGGIPTLAMTALLAAVIIVSRPGRANLTTGQATLFFTLAALSALHWARTRPMLSGLALALATIKPTIGGPLAILMLARRDWKAGLIGLATGGAAALIGWAIIFARDEHKPSLLELVRSNQSDTNRDPSFDPQLTYSRIDAPMVVERLIGPSAAAFSRRLLPLLILAVSCTVLYWLSSQFSRAGENRERLELLSALLPLVTISICIYHNIYDALLLVVPAVVLCPWANSRLVLSSRRHQWLIFGLLAIPAVSYFSSRRIGPLMEPFFISIGLTTDVARTLGLLLAVANGAAIIGAWCLLIAGALRGAKQPVETPASAVPGFSNVIEPSPLNGRPRPSMERGLQS